MDIQEEAVLSFVRGSIKSAWTLNNLLVFVDLILLPDLNLIPFRSITALAATGLLIYGFIWEIE